MKAENGGESIEKVLLDTLKYGGLARENLEELVSIVAGFYDAGLQRLKVFPRGIPPVTDGLELQANIGIDELPDISNLILRAPRISSVVYFPYGIPFVTDVNVVVGLGGYRESP